jgi:hypothetical protein
MMMRPSHQPQGYQEIIDQEANLPPHDISSYETLNRTVPNTFFPSSTSSQPTPAGDVNGSYSVPVVDRN